MAFSTPPANLIYSTGPGSSSSTSHVSSLQDMQGVQTLISLANSSVEGPPLLAIQKAAIQKHPLFPLLTTLFEKCEQGTANPDQVATTEAFNTEMELYIRRTERHEESILSGNQELDNMMIKAVQVLRIHLLELEKVHELCLDFCARYISCIKGKLNSHGLLKSDDSDSDDEFANLTCTMENCPEEVTDMHDRSEMLYQMVQTDRGIVAQPVQMKSQTSPTKQSAIHGTTPLSQIGGTAPQIQSNQDPLTSLKASTSKRGILPKQATQIMKSWLFQHIVHPYPTEEEKRQIAQQTNLSLLQVNNWFINARRRILQPMLDTGNDSLKARKNSKSQSKQVQRFWPIANICPDQSSQDSEEETSKVQTETSTTRLPSITSNTVITADGQIINPMLTSEGQTPLTAMTSPMLSQTSGGHGSPMLLQSSHRLTADSSDGGEISDNQSDDDDDDEDHQVCLNSSNSDLLANQSTDLDSV